MKAGKRYVIVPAPKMQNTTGKFFVSMYFDLPMYEVDIRKLNGKPEQYYFIPEEYEKMTKRVPLWKVQYVHDSIPTILGLQEGSSPDRIVSQLTKKKTRKL